MDGSHPPLETDDGKQSKLKDTATDVIRWDNGPNRVLKLGAFTADPTEKKVIRLELVRERSGKKSIRRDVEVPVEQLMDFN